MTSLRRTEQEDGENKAEQQQQMEESTEVEVEQDAGQIMEESAEETVDTVQVSEEVPTEQDFEASRLHEVNEELEKREEQEIVEAGDTKKRSNLTTEERDDVNNHLVHIIVGAPGMFTRRDMQRYLSSLGVFSSETQKQKQLFPIDRILPVLDNTGAFRERFLIRFENQEQVETVKAKHQSGEEKSKDKVAVRSHFMTIREVTEGHFNFIKGILRIRGVLEWEDAKRAAVVNFDKSKHQIFGKVPNLSVSAVRRALKPYNITRISTLNDYTKIVFFDSENELHRALRGTRFGAHISRQRLPQSLDNRLSLTPFK